MSTSGTNTREAFAALFQPTHPNVAWAIRQSTTAYPLDFSITTAYELLSQQVPDFTHCLEAGLSSLYDNNKALRMELQELKTQHEHLKSHSESLQALNTTQADTITALKLAINNNATAGGAAPAAPKKKRESKDPDKFAGKGSPTERQQDFEIWISKIRSVFARDSTYFDTAVSQILHIGDLLEGKAYEYISDGINKMLSNPTNPANWQWQDREGLLQHLSTHYVTLDTTQTAKHKLDDFPQKGRNYWSWKAELDEAMTRAKKTEEQKVDLLRKWINPKMKGLVTGLPHIIPDDDYDAWSKQMDTFARNLAILAHQENLEKKTPALAQTQTLQPTQAAQSLASPVGDPMQLDRLSDQERQRRVTNKLCLACGEPGHWKDAHDPARTTNPLPMPSRPYPTQGRGQSPFDMNRGRGRGGYTGRGRGTPYTQGNQRDNQVTPYMGGQRYFTNQQWQVRAGDYNHQEQGSVTSEESSYFAPTEFDTTQNTSQSPSPAPQSVKDEPLK